MDEAEKSELEAMRKEVRAIVENLQNTVKNITDDAALRKSFVLTR